MIPHHLGRLGRDRLVYMSVSLQKLPSGSPAKDASGGVRSTCIAAVSSSAPQGKVRDRKDVGDLGGLGSRDDKD